MLKPLRLYQAVRSRQRRNIGRRHGMTFSLVVHAIYNCDGRCCNCRHVPCTSAQGLGKTIQSIAFMSALLHPASDPLPGSGSEGSQARRWLQASCHVAHP